MRPNTSSTGQRNKTNRAKSAAANKQEKSIDQVGEANKLEVTDDENNVGENSSLVESNSDFGEDVADGESDLEDFEHDDLIDDAQWDTDIEDDSGNLNINLSKIYANNHSI